MQKLFKLAKKAHKKIKNSYQSNDNPKWPVQIRIGSNIFFHVLNWCTSWNNRRHNSFFNYVCINIEEFLIKFNAKYGMFSSRTVIIIIWKRADKKKSQTMNLQMIKLVYFTRWASLVSIFILQNIHAGTHWTEKVLKWIVGCRLIRCRGGVLIWWPQSIRWVNIDFRNSSLCVRFMHRWILFERQQIIGVHFHKYSLNIQVVWVIK